MKGPEQTQQGMFEPRRYAAAGSDVVALSIGGASIYDSANIFAATVGMGREARRSEEAD